jgi:hypothetical protein
MRLDGQSHLLAVLIPGKRLCTHCKVGWVGPRAVLDEGVESKISCPHQAVVSRCAGLLIIKARWYIPVSLPFINSLFALVCLILPQVPLHASLATLAFLRRTVINARYHFETVFSGGS